MIKRNIIISRHNLYGYINLYNDPNSSHFNNKSHPSRPRFFFRWKFSTTTRFFIIPRPRKRPWTYRNRILSACQIYSNEFNKNMTVPINFREENIAAPIRKFDNLRFCWRWRDAVVNQTSPSENIIILQGEEKEREESVAGQFLTIGS